MADWYASVIVDIALSTLDKTFQYRIPAHLKEKITPGVRVRVPFGNGNRTIGGYVIEVTDTPEYSVEATKNIGQIEEESQPVEGQLIQVAAWMKRRYGSTMIQALKTVLPVKKKMAAVEKKYIVLKISKEEAGEKLDFFRQKKQYARIRLFEALCEEETLPYEVVTHKLNISQATLKPLVNAGIIEINREIHYRNPIKHLSGRSQQIKLNQEQQQIIDEFRYDWSAGIRRTYLLYGITGSGKTEVYMEMIAEIIKEGKQAIVLIPEIALTYQTIMRFYHRFGERVSLINSRLSAGERFDQFERAKRGEIDVMVGPRSALFTPFAQLGLIVIDEEHEGAYKSETAPRYHARETAIFRARLCGASVVLGSATPSVESYECAARGEYRLFTLTTRAKKNSVLPEVEIVDLRAELKKGNKSIFSLRLQELMTERLERNEQVILFLNRRGYSGFLCCRSCGKSVKCPHCDVSMTAHNNGRLVCHYCGYSQPLPTACPSCGSPYISGFGIGTQKVEDMTKKMFPKAAVLRMDLDTTAKKGEQEKILAAFASREADILIGTQMIVKGHDFPFVTLVGVLAADMSLNAHDYRAGERTFELLTQAAGRAGRSSLPGNVVIQTYNPEHFSIQTAANQDFLSFYQQEILYRKMLGYPPYTHMLAVMVMSDKKQTAQEAAGRLKELIERNYTVIEGFVLIGPADALVSKVNDIYRKMIYIKHQQADRLIEVKDRLENNFCIDRNIMIQFDLS